MVLAKKTRVASSPPLCVHEASSCVLPPSFLEALDDQTLCEVTAFLVRLTDEEVSHCVSSCLYAPFAWSEWNLRKGGAPNAYLMPFHHRAGCSPPDLVLLRRTKACLSDWVALACCSQTLRNACCCAPLAWGLANPDDLLSVAARFGLGNAFEAALKRLGAGRLPASQAVVPVAVDRYAWGRVGDRGTALHSAVLSGSTSTVSAVAAACSQEVVNARDSVGHTALYLACVHRASEARQDTICKIATLLLAARAKPDAHSGCLEGASQAGVRPRATEAYNSDTPLLAACRRRNVPLVDLLLRHGANVHNTKIGPPREKNAPVSAAVGHDPAVRSRRGRDEILMQLRVVDLLLAARAAVDGLATFGERELCLSSGFPAGRSALHVAARDDHTGLLVDRLLRARAGVDSPDMRGETPLFVASFFRNRACCDVLRAAGAREIEPKEGVLVSDAVPP